MRGPAVVADGDLEFVASWSKWCGGEGVEALVERRVDVCGVVEKSGCEDGAVGMRREFESEVGADFGDHRRGR